MEFTLQIFLLLFTAGFAVIGVLAPENVDKRTGKPTIWGKWAIAGAIVLFAIGVAIQISQSIERERARREADAATQQANEIRRAVYTTTGLKASFAIAYPLPTDGSSA